MNTRKNYNSIVFLTVYLGLVLVGATPQVLAQAATPRLFDIKTEIEFKDNLDKKPDEEEKIDFSGSLENYFDEVEDLIENLIKLHQIEKFDSDYDKFEITELGFVPCNTGGDPTRISNLSEKIDNRWLEPALRETRYSFENSDFFSDCLKDEKFKTGVSTSSKLKLYYDKSELKIEVSAFKYSPQRAEYLANRFEQASEIYEVDEENSIVKTIHKNTSFKSENNQVFIVTRLPRAAIDEFLAVKNAR